MADVEEFIVQTLLKHQELTHHSADMFTCECGADVLWQANFDFNPHIYHQAQAVISALGLADPRHNLKQAQNGGYYCADELGMMCAGNWPDEAGWRRHCTALRVLT